MYFFKKNRINITVVGAGYVGLSLGLMLSRYNQVKIYDINKNKINRLKQRISPFQDKLVQDYLKKSKVIFSDDRNDAYLNADYIIIATPTDFDDINGTFDTTLVDDVVHLAHKLNPEAVKVIKSTLPIGHTDKIKENLNTDKVIFSPEFLREGSALHDNLYPSRIVIGSSCQNGYKFAKILKKSSFKKDVDIIYVPSKEAESIKLFSNAYLAMRVAFFNELDTFALDKKLDTESVIRGVSLDKRIGDFYNNPSFGYGGYCLPKDTKQLLKDFDSLPQSIIESIVESNDKRKAFIANQILKSKPSIVGFYKLEMKKNSDNIRFSSIQDIIKHISSKGIKTIIFEPQITEKEFLGSEVMTDLKKFKNMSDIIVLNRYSEDLNDVRFKCFTRDIFKSN